VPLRCHGQPPRQKQAEVQAAIEKQTEELFAAQSGADAGELCVARSGGCLLLA